MSELDSAPWTWPEERWREAVARIRGGRSLKPKRWKNGRCAVALTFDCAFETVALGKEPVGLAMAEGEYGARAGLPRILRVLKGHNVQGTFFMPATAALLHGELAKGLVAAGHEVGLTSWSGEPSDLAPETERELLTGARSTLETITGLKAAGFRAGNGLSPNTLSILHDLNIAYDSSLVADDDPYVLTVAGETTQIIELPFGLDDSTLFNATGGTSPEEVFDIFRRELEIAADEGGLLVLRLHPEIVGRRSRVWILDEFIKVARTLPGTWITTLADVAASLKGRGGL